MNELTQRINSNTPAFLTSNPELVRQGREVVRETAVSMLKVDGSATVAQRIMDRIVDLDQDRRALAGNDQLLNSLLAEVELTFARRAMRVQNRLFDEYGV